MKNFSLLMPLHYEVEMTDFKNTLGKKIVLARKAAAMSQRALAEKLGITQQALSGYERGKTHLTVKLLVDICDILDAPYSLFLPNTKPYGNIISQDDIDLLNELHRYIDSVPLIEFIRSVRRKSNVTKSRGLHTVN